MNGPHEEAFWESYAENHFWRLNDKSKVKENSVYYDRIYDSLLPGNRTARILDIGCGGGHFLHYLGRKGYTGMEGIDLSPGLVRFVKEEIWPGVRQGDAMEYLRSRRNSYDVLVANDFLEHLKKDVIIEFLFLCHDALADKGILLLKTPNMSHPFASRNRYVDFSHEIGFTEHSLHEVCAAARFGQVDILSEHHCVVEPKVFAWVRKLYVWMGQAPPKVLSTNLVAVCRK
jgi:2-polyprenyl-3-methyl-5-hydroxy-6-metoxy-1,4-benzoquinol methylase